MPSGGSSTAPRPIRLHVVTGKGGTGKTTVAAALALALASGGGRVLLVEVEGRQGIAQLFDVPPLPYEERRIAAAPEGGEVFALAIEPGEALLEYLTLFYHLRGAGMILNKIGAIEFATTLAPGVRDVLLTGKVKEAVVRRDKAGAYAYDAIVLDAPPTGRITRFLNVTADVSALARMGPVKSQADGVQRIVRSDRTAVHLVTLLEEMPVQETVDGVAELTAAGIPVGRVVVNMRRQPYELPARIVKKTVAAGLADAGLDATPALVDGLAAEAKAYRARTALEERELTEVAALGRPVVELAQQPGQIDTAALLTLADALLAQGVEPARRATGSEPPRRGAPEPSRSRA